MNGREDQEFGASSPSRLSWQKGRARLHTFSLIVTVARRRNEKLKGVNSDIGRRENSGLRNNIKLLQAPLQLGD